jgi:uncharacterized protein (DUF2141 family)
MSFEVQRNTARNIGPRRSLLVDIFCAFAQPEAPQENQIHVEIVGSRNDKCQVLCSLFSSAGDFPKKMEKAVAHSTSVITNRHAACEFSAVAPGTYAISVFHDENSNGKLDTTLWGFLARASEPRTTQKAISDRPNSMPPHFVLRVGGSN